jgi:hypothetical protein
MRMWYSHADAILPRSYHHRNGDLLANCKLGYRGVDLIWWLGSRYLSGFAHPRSGWVRGSLGTRLGPLSFELVQRHGLRQHQPRGIPHGITSTSGPLVSSISGDRCSRLCSAYGNCWIRCRLVLGLHEECLL